MLTTFSGRNPSQDEWELLNFIALLQTSGVKSYLEIGAREGDTFHEVMMHLPKHAKGVACDLPGGLWGKSTTGAQLENSVQAVRKSGRQAHKLLGDSTSDLIIQSVQECGPYDAILIDGDHTYEGVRKDWQNFGGMAKIVAFHDIVGTGQKENVYGTEVAVPILWEEIKCSGMFRTVEFIAPRSKMGIGVVLS